MDVEGYYDWLRQIDAFKKVYAEYPNTKIVRTSWTKRLKFIPEEIPEADDISIYNATGTYRLNNVDKWISTKQLYILKMIHEGKSYEEIKLFELKNK